MQIKLHWHEPIELGSSGTLRQTFKNFDFKYKKTTSYFFLL